MKPSSAKNKGRKFQQECGGDVLEHHPSLTTRDVVSRSMGAGGSDLMLSEAAVQVFPYNVECKSLKAIGKVYDFYEQACAHNTDGLEPLVMCKANSSLPLCIVSRSHFLELTSKAAILDRLLAHQA